MLNVVFLAAGLFAAMLLLLELGRRIGLRRRARDPEGYAAGLGALDGAIFALMGLLLAFTFSGAAGRFDTRRQLIVEEANAIGTAYLRVELLSPAAQGPLKDLFRRYVDARLAAYAKMPDIEAARAELARAAEIQAQIWTQAVAAAKGDSYPPAAMLLLPAINQMIDITTTRTVAAQTHPPQVIYGMLFVILLGSSLLAGHNLAAGRVRSMVHMIGFAATMAVSIYVILDIEYPRHGLIRLDAFDQVLADVRASMK